HPREAAGRRAHRAALSREAFPRPRGAAAPPGRALEHRAVCVGGGALPGRGGRLRTRAQARLAGAHRRRRRGFLRRRPAGGGGRGRAGALQAARGRGWDVRLGRHRLLGCPVAHPHARRTRQRGGREGDRGGRRAPLGDLVRERARRRHRPRRHGGRAGERPHARDAHRPRRAPEGARPAVVTHALYLLDPDPAPAWAPFAGARPLCELRAGAHLIRERWETFIGAESSAIFALPHLAGFAEAGVPLVAARRPVPGPAVIGSSTFAPRGLAPSLPEGAFRLTSGGVTVGWGVGAGATWDGPQPHAAAIEVPGVVHHGVYDLVPALEQLLPDDLRALLGDSDPLPPGSAVLGDPAAIALRDAAVEPGVVFDVRNGPVVLESGAEVRAGARLEGPLWVGANAHVLGGPVRASAIGPRTNARGELSSCVFLGYANKAHDGFVGHCVIGRWANLGAGKIGRAH